MIKIFQINEIKGLEWWEKPIVLKHPLTGIFTKGEPNEEGKTYIRCNILEFSLYLSHYSDNVHEKFADEELEEVLGAQLNKIAMWVRMVNRSKFKQSDTKEDEMLIALLNFFIEEKEDDLQNN